MVRAELGQAVTAALDWLRLPPHQAGPLLGLHHRTLEGMCQGIVPMRSLIIRFADGISRQCEQHPGAPTWWGDVDAWLQVAGYPPRREGAPTVLDDPASRRRPGRTLPPAGYPERTGPHSNSLERLPGTPASPPSSSPPRSNPRFSFRSPHHNPGQNGSHPTSDVAPGESHPAPVSPPATQTYRPVYETVPGRNTVTHVFWLLDQEDRRRFRISVPGHQDYRSRAAEVKLDLQQLSRDDFEWKYRRYRIG